MYGGDTLTVLLVYEALYNDMALGVLSFAIVFLLTLNHLNSLFLAVTGLVQIICTFPVVFFLYEWIVGDLKLGILNVLSIYLVLGIGVDDLFVLVDAYKQEAQHVRARRSRVSFFFLFSSTTFYFLTIFFFILTKYQSPDIASTSIETQSMVAVVATGASRGSARDASARDASARDASARDATTLELGLYKGYRRAAGSMLLTSFTTGMSFVCNLGTAIPVIQSFMVFMSLLIVTNYLMVVSIYPVLVVIWSKHVQPREQRCFQRCFSRCFQRCFQRCGGGHRRRHPHATPDGQEGHNSAAASLAWTFELAERSRHGATKVDPVAALHHNSHKAVPRLPSNADSAWSHTSPQKISPKAKPKAVEKNTVSVVGGRRRNRKSSSEQTLRGTVWGNKEGEEREEGEEEVKQNSGRHQEVVAELDDTIPSEAHHTGAVGNANHAHTTTHSSAHSSAYTTTYTPTQQCLHAHLAKLLRGRKESLCVLAGSLLVVVVGLFCGKCCESSR